MITKKNNRRFKLVILCELKAKEGSLRWVRRSNKYDNRWYSQVLPFLYARQVARWFNYNWTAKGKGLMEIPYSVQDVYDSEEQEKLYCSEIIDINSKSGYAKKKGFKQIKSEITGSEILEEELTNE